MDSLKNIYSKDIEREIQGVIKVDDESYISQELEEYVVTEELLKHLRSFFEAYNESIDGKTEKMGVWVSGFFGSGKSHFLKIISYLLENKVVNGKHAVDYFDDKIEDKQLLAQIKKAGNVSNDVILFNIDSKTTISNGIKDRIIEVFERVFNEKLGLSSVPFVAEIERFLIEENKYEDFKRVFKEISGRDWEAKRDAIPVITDEFTQTYVKVMNKSEEEARNIIEMTDKKYALSVEKFAERVRKYVETKGSNYHVIFIVDEIGQYIGDDRSLMLNLQTIVEDLGLQCGGKAWVVVTSQEAIDDVIKVQGNDFSKIQGRFDTKLSLSSSDIDEVIKKRILDKTEDSMEDLMDIYDEEASVIKNLLTFKNATYQKVYENSSDFAQTYPFIPYQFKLLQDVFTEIRTNGYAGKHLSSGERSLLGAVQEIAKRYSSSNIGTLIPFYAFYDTIEQFLEHQIKIVIKTAQDTVKSGELEEIDVKVLKMLFMLKDIKEIHTNIDNLATLYVSNINDDKISLKKEIADSLRRLEAQTLIQRNNDEYKFLTDEEQEINRQIKRMVVDENKVTEYLQHLIYDGIFIDTKFTYRNRNFQLSRYMNNTKYSLDYEIGVKVLAIPSDKDDSEIIMQSSRENNYVFVKLEMSTLIYDEITNYIKVNEYRRIKNTELQTPQVEAIITTKQREAESAELRVREYVKEQLNGADIIISGDIQKISSREARTRLNEALEILVNNIYTKFLYVEKNYTIQDIKDIFHENIKKLTSTEDLFENQKAIEAIKEYCEEKEMCSIPITIRTLLQNFASAPYGFLDEDILYLLTRLLKKEVISLICNNEVQSITSEETLSKILKKEYYDKTLIKLRQKISNTLISNLTSVARNAFNVINLREDEDGMVEDFKKICLTENINTLKSIIANYEINKEYQYPGKNNIDEALNLFESLLKIRDVVEFFNEISNKKQEILEVSKKVGKVLEFFESEQKIKFDKARSSLMVYDNNKDYTDQNEELQIVTEEMVSILTASEPYSEIHKLRNLRENLNKILTQMYEVKSKPIIEMINCTISYIENEIEIAGVDETFGKYYIDTCKSVINTLEHSSELKDIFAQQTRIEQLRDNFKIALEREKNKMCLETEDEEKSEEVIVEPKVVRLNNIMNPFYRINTKEDVETYIEDLKGKLLKELEENKSILIRQ